MSEPRTAEIPGGTVEPGEGPHAAAIREVWEETGVAVRLTDWLGDVEEPDGRLVRYYLADVLGEVPDEHRDADGGQVRPIHLADLASAPVTGSDRLAVVFVQRPASRP